MPIKRTEALIPLSREHHHGLLLCWKIRSGIKYSISADRIKKYADWFFREHLLPHFKVEEQGLFPLAGTENELVQHALSEHQVLRKLFSENAGIDTLQKIADELESHIRFEERVLFNYIQESASAEALQTFRELHGEDKAFADNFSDPFWERKSGED